MTRLVFLASSLLFPLLSVPAYASPIVDASGQLTGATDVDVNGVLYDVQFIDGSCIALFSDCDAAADLDFPDPQAAQDAAQALVDQVFLDGQLGAFDTDYTLTRGCEDNVSGSCWAIVPSEAIFSPFGMWVAARNTNSVTVNDITQTLDWGIGDDTSGLPQFVFARFTPVGGDSDHDGVPDDQDICPGGDDNIDTDEDGVPDFCDLCPIDPENDSDGDGVCDSEDFCLGDDATGDDDGDAVCNDQDPCFGSPNTDDDGDGICDSNDACIGDDAFGDSDGDGVCDDIDLCLGNDATGDTDADGTCDDIDVCPFDAENDADGDGLCESEDNCPIDWNSSQTDTDEDGLGDECDPDIDGDDVPNEEDNCPFDFNPGQEDFDEDGAGDLCDTDDDDDGVQDDGDECPMTAPGDVVAGNGCSIDQLCPCENNWKNHGAYVRCVAHTSEVFVDLGLITEEQKDLIVSEAAESACGHKN